MMKNTFMVRKIICLSLCLFAFLMFGYAQSEREGKVRVWEENLVIPTYLVGEADKLPRFFEGRAYQGAKGPVYPYPMLDKLTDMRKDRSYRALYLENDYIQICVLPEIGGRIFSALDKTNTYDFFYRQHVIKPALIGMTGAWISGGVEWNIPHHHRATSFMPVDYQLSENLDGSKTIWVGELELRHRMTWLVGLTLYPDRSYIEAAVKIMNRTPFAHSILCWANVAVHTNKDYQIIFPPGTEFATYHGKNQFSEWPISRQVYNRTDYTQGVDIRWWKNHPSPTSFFAWNYEDDFLAGYDHGRDAGVVHVADHHLVPGKKFWTWGTGEQGQMWEKLLTETDGPYIELMVGAFSDNQPDYSWLQPYEVRTVKLYWYPIRNIKGVKNSNLEAAVNLEFAGEKGVQLGFNTTGVHKGAIVRLESGGHTVFEDVIDIGPPEPYFRLVDLPGPVDEKLLRAVLLSSEGKELISYQPVERKGGNLPEPVKPPQPPSTIQSVEELYLTGLRLEQFYSPVYEPDPYYEEALKRDPGDSRANTAMGILNLKRGMFEAAEEKLRIAVERNTHSYSSPKDGEPFYYLGLALRFQKDFDGAGEAFQKAAWSQAWSAASYYSLAELACLRRDYQKALEYCDRSLLGNAWNQKCQSLKSVILRKLGRLQSARQLAERNLGFSPLDFLAGNELFLVKSQLGLKEEARVQLDSLAKAMRNSVQSYLELATDYGNCGFWEEAIDVLTRWCDAVDKNAANPLVYYYLAFYSEQNGDEEKASLYYKTAARMPEDHCFPFRLETIGILLRAHELYPQDARSIYYLGNLLFDIQPERAVECWEKSVSLDSKLSLAWRNLGLGYARVSNDVKSAVQCLEKAVRLNPEEPRLYYELDLLYEAAAKSPRERLQLLERNHKTVKGRDDAYSREIMLLVETGDYSRAIELLGDHHFHVWEGGGQIHDVYVDAHLLRGLQYFREKRYEEALKDFLLALEYPENLEVGRPSHGGRAAQVFYHLGTVHEALGDLEKARAFYQNSVEQERGLSELSFFQAISLEKLGKDEEAAEICRKLVDLGKERLEGAVSLDFFVKFGERQSAARRQAQAYYLLGLGYLGQGNEEEARAAFKKALELNINHIWARHFLELYLN